MVEVKKNFLNEWTISFAFPFNKMNEIILIKYDMGVKVDMWCNCLLFVHFFSFVFSFIRFQIVGFVFMIFKSFPSKKENEVIAREITNYHDVHLGWKCIGSSYM